MRLYLSNVVSSRGTVEATRTTLPNRLVIHELGALVSPQIHTDLVFPPTSLEHVVA